MQHFDKKPHLPTGAEMRLLQILWELGSGTVEQVVDAHTSSPDAPRDKPNYKTTQTLLRIMEQKGFIAHEAQGRVFVFRPIVSRKAVDQDSVRTLLQQNFAGSPSSLFVNLLEASSMKEEELAELEASIQEYREKRENKP